MIGALQRETTEGLVMFPCCWGCCFFGGGGGGGGGVLTPSLVSLALFPTTDIFHTALWRFQLFKMGEGRGL